MNNIFQLKPLISDLDIKDAIDERLIKMEAIVNCLLATRDSAVEFNTNTLYEVIWAISDFFDEINLLQKQ